MCLPPRLLRLCCALVLGALSVVMVPVLSSPAQSASTRLCSGYTACTNAGYSDAGYGAVNNRMYWRMYSGHNCTNYAAYRMIKNGVSSTRPWSGSGMARNWGHAMASITNQTPSVGAIAWWDRKSGGVGSSGHVAYVEKVVSANEIVISEDSWSGDFHWRKIVKGSSWPSGFIHFADQATTPAITNTVPPTVTGTPQVGQNLTAATGTWSPAAAITWQWYADGVAIPNAQAYYYAPTAAMVGKTISLLVTAKRTGYTTATKAVAVPGVVTAGGLATTTPPVITGAAEVGSTLSATAGTYTPAAESAVIKWTSDGKLLAGAQGATLALTPALVGRKIGTQVVARRDGYNKTLASATAVGPVTQGTVQFSTAPAATGQPLIGKQLSATAGTVTPADATVTYAWLRNGAAIAGATGPTYTLGGADLGAKMSVVVSGTKANWTVATQTLPIAGTVKTISTTRASAVARTRSAIIAVRVTAPGVSAPTGKALVKVGKSRQTVNVVRGKARVVLAKVKPGKRAVVVVYSGTPTIVGSRAKSRINVPR